MVGMAGFEPATDGFTNRVSKFLIPTRVFSVRGT
jgi:hypothetical protein